MPDAEQSAPQTAELGRRLRATGSLHWLHWVVLSASLVITLSAWYFSTRQLEEKISNRFDRESDRVLALVTERMQKYEDALWGGVGMINSHGGEISHSKWRQYADTLSIESKYPGTNGIGVIYAVRTSQMDEYLQEQHEDRPAFHVRPQHERALKLPITFIEPLAGNREALGLDIAHEKNRYQGAVEARDSGKAQITGPIVLVQDDGQTPGFLFYVPFYSGVPSSPLDRVEKFKGLVYAPFVVNKLMKGTLASEKRHVSVTIRDGGVVLYDEDQGDERGIDAARFQRIEHLSLYGRQWEFAIWSNDAFASNANESSPRLILFGGVLIDVLLLVLFLSMSRTSRMAVQYAEALTQDLRVKTERLEFSNTELAQFAYVASHDLRSPVRAIGQVVGWMEEDGVASFSEDTREHLHLIRSRLGRMDDLLTSLLEYSRWNRQEQVISEIDLDEMFRDIAAQFPRPEHMTIKVEGRAPSFLGYRMPVEQVLRNLVDNAVRHHDGASGTVILRAHVEQESICMEVEDDGPGIPESMREKVFEVFQTLRRRDEFECTGIGLAIVKKNVTNARGSIRIVSSESGKGVVFRVIWPKMRYDENGTSLERSTSRAA